MELIMNPQPLIAATLQHPIPGAILYPGKGSAWQPVVTSMPSLVEAQVPKETIIANTDFTTTSLIAKRRLSSKKRKKTQQTASAEAGSSEAMEQSPSSTPGGRGSPAVTSTTFTPPACNKSNQTLGESTLVQHHHLSTTSNSPTSHTNPTTTMIPTSNKAFVAVCAPGYSNNDGISSQQQLLHHSQQQQQHIVGSTVSTSTGQTVMDPSQLAGGEHTGGVVVTSNGYLPAMASNAPHPSSFAAMAHHHKQFTTNPVFNQMQQELNYRYLQEQSGVIVHRQRGGAVGVVHPQPHTEHPRVHSSSAEHRNGNSQQAEFRWCRAHVTIARQIQQHQQRAKAAEAAAIAVSQAQQSTIPKATATHPHLPHQTVESTLSHQQQQQQQLALLQMYGVPTNTAALAAAPPPASYNVLAVPYPVHELQLRMQSYNMQLASRAPLLANSGVSLVKPQPPLVAAVSNVAGGNMSSHVAGCNMSSDPNATSVVNLNPIQVVNGVQIHHAAPYAPIAPVTALVPHPNEFNPATFVHGTAMGTDGAAGSNSGSWVAQGVPVFGSCINPLQPGIMATQWVK